MITKTYLKTGSSCRVTFKIPSGPPEAQSAVVLGEWNGWNPDATPMKRGKDGSWSATVTLETGRPYHFRYLLDGRHWKNDEGADKIVRNPFGTEDSVLSLDREAPAAPTAKKAAPAKAAKTAKPAPGNGKPAAKSPAKTPAKAPVKTAAKAAKAIKPQPKPAAPTVGAAPEPQAPKTRKTARRSEAKER
jgi:hypothetical protein